MNKTPDTSHHVSEESWVYPTGISRRADELTSELESKQQLLLYSELNTKDVHEWLGWFEDERELIYEYDKLSANQRSALLRKSSPTELLPVLSLHHACIFLELWHSRTVRRYFCFPPSGESIDAPVAQRRLMIDLAASYRDYDDRDFWTFDNPEIVERWPFRKKK